MANEFKVKKGLIVHGSGSTILDIQGSQGQLFSVTDSLTGDLFSVSDISGVPIFNVNSSGVVDVDAYMNIDGYINLSGTTTGYYIGGSGGGEATNKLRIGSTTTTNTVALEIYHSANPVSLGIDYDGGAGLAFIESVHGSYDVNTHLLFKPGGTETWRIGSHGTSSDSVFLIKPASNTYDFIVADAGGTPIITADSGTKAVSFAGAVSTGGYLTLNSADNIPRLIFNGSGDDFFFSNTATYFGLYNSTDSRWDIKVDGAGDTTFGGKILAGLGTTAAATINAYTATVSTGLYSALRIIDNTAASSYWDIGAVGGGTPDLKFFANAGTAPKFTLTNAGNATFTGDVTAVNVIPTTALRIGAADKWKIRGNNSNNNLAFEYAASTTLADANIKLELTSTTATFAGDVIVNGGNLGVGMTATEVLDIKTTSGDCRMRLDAPSGSDTEIKFFNAGAAQYTIGHDDDSDEFRIGTANVEDPMLSFTKSKNATFAGEVTATRFNVDSTSNYIDTIGSYLSFKSGGNEMTFGGSTSMYINYRAALGGTPVQWIWNAGSSTSYAKFILGELDVRSSALFAGAVTVKSGNKLILNRPNNAVASEISTDAAGTMILNSVNDEGFKFQNAGTTFLTLDTSNNTTFAGNITTSGELTINNNASDNNKGIHIKNDTDAYGGGITFWTEYSGTDTNIARIQGGTNGSNGILYLQTANTSKVLTTALSLDFNQNANFASSVTTGGDLTVGGTTGSGGNALSVNRGSDGAQALRVQNSGEVVIPSNYLYASAAGTSMYVQNTAVFRGSIVNDGGNVTIGDTLNVTDDILANGHIYGRSVNNSYSHLYRFGGLFFTWDSDNYGTNTHHSIRSTYGDTFQDSITLNSYNHIRFNIDSNNNNSTSYFEVGDGTTATGNVIFRLTNNGTLLLNATAPTQTYSASAPIKLSVQDGMSEFETTLTNNNDWENSPISILERGNIGTGGGGADKYSPNLNFHWSGRVSNSLWMNSSGHLHYGSYTSAGVPATDGTFKAAHGLFNSSVEAGALLKFGTNGFADIVNIGTGAIRFKPSGQTLALTLTGANATFAGNVSMISGNATGKFAVKSAAVHSSYDFYNDGTSYFNGAVTIDHNLDMTNSGVIKMAGTEVISAARHISATTGTFTGNVTAPSFIGKLMGGATGAPDATIWCVSGDYTDWGIFYDQDSPDVIQFKSSGNVKATVSLDHGDYTGRNATFTGTVTAQEFHTEFVSASIVHESGSTKFGDTADDIHSFTGSLGISGSVTIQADDADFLVRSKDYTISRIISRGNTGTNLDKGLFSLMSSDGTNNNVENIRLDSAGNSWFNGGKVGIGAVSPLANLDISNDAGSVYQQWSYDNPGANNYNLTLSETVTSGNVRFCFNQRNLGSNYANVLVFNKGKVGIGTDEPNHKLTVNGDIGLTNGKRIWFRGSSASSATGAQSYVFSDGLNLKIKGDDNVQLLGDGGGVIAHFDYTGKVGIGTTSPTYNLSVSGGISAGGKVTYSKFAGSLDTTGYAVAGITAFPNGNGASCGFTFTCFGHTGAYQRIVYSCYNGTGTWYAKKVIDEGTNQLDVVASANGSTITFTFKATSSSMSYTPRVTVEAIGTSINSTYA